MSNHSVRVPSYRCKRVNGYKYACVSLPDGKGGRRDFTLGDYGSEESRKKYAQKIAEWEAKDPKPTEGDETIANDLTVNEVLAAYFDHAEAYYRDKDGKPTGELAEIKLAIRPLRELFGHIPAAKFGPKRLKALRRQMMRQPITVAIKETDPQTGQRVTKQKLLRIGLCRGVINQRIHKIRRAFRWACSEELIDAKVYTRLATLEGLRAGRSEARESNPVRSVAEALIADTLPLLSPTVADMLRLLMHTGMRAGELCIMRGADLDTTGNVWTYTPHKHKTEHHGHERVIAIGPRAQEIIRRYLKPDLQAYLFSPADSVRAFRARQRRERKSKVQPSQIDRSKRRPKRKPRERYDTRAIAHAVNRACRKHGLPSWHPHQLRHLAGTLARKQFGLDHAQASLGHRSANVTTLYAELSKEKAAEVAARLG
jgi:integrase